MDFVEVSFSERLQDEIVDFTKRLGHTPDYVIVNRHEWQRFEKQMKDLLVYAANNTSPTFNGIPVLFSDDVMIHL